MEVDQATYFEAEPPETIPAVTGMVVTVGYSTPEPMADTPTPLPRVGPIRGQSVPNRVISGYPAPGP